MAANSELWKKASDSFKSIDIQKYLNIEERQLKIYETAEGTLFNQEVIEKNADIIEIPKNIKRDYSFASYKEQLADLQLRKEIADKNRKAGILTEKQKKAVELEIKNEGEIRNSLKQLHDLFEGKVKLIFVACKKEPQFAFNYINLFYDYIVPLIKSPLVAKIAVRGYLSFRDAIFEVTSDDLYKLISHATLRVLDSKFLMDHWCEISMEEQIRQSFHLLSSSCFLYLNLFDEEEEEEKEEDLNGKEEEEEEIESKINGAKLAFILPFFEQFLKKTPEKFDIDLRIRVAKFLQTAVNGKFIKPEELTSMPLLKLASLLVDCICLDQSIEYINDLKLTLNQFLEMFNQNKMLINTKDAICSISPLLKLTIENNKELFQSFIRDIYLSKHDSNIECSNNALNCWESLNFNTSSTFYKTLLQYLHDDKKLKREDAGKAMQSLSNDFPLEVSEMLKQMGLLYKQFMKFQPAQFDSVGRKLKEESDPSERREGITTGIFLITDSLVSSQQIMSLLHLVVPDGLNDRAEGCRNLMRNAAAKAIQNHGSEMVDTLFPFIEEELNKLTKEAKNDNLRQGLVVLIGTLAQYLKEDNAKVRKIVARLIEALSTPSQQVQESVAGCLPALIPFLKNDARALIENMFMLLTSAESYGERRGAAYGIGSIIKGLGVASIKQMNINSRLKDMLAQKQKPLFKEGALLCIEILCSTVGKLFEPYLVHLLPDLLTAFGDTSEAVRRTADDTAKAMMRSLSAHGVKLLLPSLLKGLDDDSWRTKCASAELLGAMSNCAPRQLSTSLPSIVPKLCEALTDTHGKVQKTSERALKQIAQVIQNPECLAISSHLIQALADPPGKTSSCLQTIVNNKFVHYIDSPSLALMMPIIYRALADRNTEARRMAAQVLSNIYSLVDNKDMEPYLDSLIPGLKKALCDPVPEVRTVASKAMGAIVQYSAPATSEKIQADIMPWLKENLVSESSSVDRQGAAQGLSELIAAIGGDFLEQNLPGVIKITESATTEPYIRDGYILLYIYLPIALGEKFAPFIGKIIPSILQALADETEYLRESALRAGNRLITVYSNHARKLLLPQLQAALIYQNWRIRQASVKLIGDFLFNISGVSGKMTSETAGEDDTMGSEAVNKAIVRCIGQRSRDELLAGIYLVRYDVALAVRQVASHVWKVIVSNTPRTLKDIMRPLFELLLHCLSSSIEDQQQMSVRCLSEIVKKMGERVLAVILPILEDRLKNGGSDDRRGVALALGEIISNTHREIVETYSVNFVNSIRTCLSDKNKSVREAASKTFIVFYGMQTSNYCVERIVAPLLDEFNQNNQTHVLEGLCSIMDGGQCGRQLFQSILPKLSKPPVNSLALCRLSICTDALKRNMREVMAALLCDKLNVPMEEHVQNCIPVLFSVDAEEDVRAMLSCLLKSISNQKNALTSVTLLKEFIENNEDEFSSEQLDLLVSGFISLYNQQDSDVISLVIETFNSLNKQIETTEYIELVLVLKRALKALHLDVKNSKKEFANILCLPKGWKPIIVILREGILSGSVEIKEVAANCITQAVQLSDENGLKPHVVNVAGPLIRVLGEKQPVPVKIAAINGLNKLLEKMPLLLKTFLPQMQSVFIKIIQDPASTNLRQLAAQGIRHILSFHTKPEHLLKELNKLKEFDIIDSGGGEGGEKIDLRTDKLLNDLINQVENIL
uniref:TOG domain-containing protein n=1 Tax=Meloidogyne hapla TaxID=6305 RepID=A0A1I8BXN9_MELHA